MACIFSRPTHRTFRPFPVYPQVSFNVFGEPVYEGYAPGSGLSPYGDRDLYLYALATKQQHQRRRQEEYAYAAAQAALARQQQEERERRRREYEYAAALALEERRHKAAVRQIAERKAAASNQKQYNAFYYALFSAESSSFEPCARGAAHQTAIRITKARAEQALRLAEEQQRRRRVSLEQGRQRQSALAFLNALFGQGAESDENKPEEKQPKGKEREAPTSHYAPENVAPAQSQSQPKPVEIKANVAGPSNSQQSDSAPAPASRARSLSAISGIEHEFTALRDSFTFPATLDFSPSSISVPQLAYNSTNLPLRAYEQQLTNLLTKLDEVDSEGVQGVRDARKKLVRDIEQVLEEMDKRKEEVWEKTVVLDKDAEVPVDEPQPKEKVVLRTDEELEHVEEDNIATRVEEQVEYADAPAQEQSSSIPEPNELPAPQNHSTDAVVGYDLSPVPASSPIEVDSTPATVTEEASLPVPAKETSAFISPEVPSGTATPSPFDTPTPIDTVVLPHGAEAAQPTADEDMQSSSDEEEERSVDDGVVLTAEDDGTLVTEEVEDGSGGGSDFEML